MPEELRQQRTKLNIPGMCADGPPSYSVLDTKETDRFLQRDVFSRMEEGKTYCVHFSSIREILTSQELKEKIRLYPEGTRVDIDHFHQVPAGTRQDPQNLWLRKMHPNTGSVTITNTEENPWDLNVLLFLPDDASPVNPGSTMMEIYTAMVIADRSRDRDFSDQSALDRSKEDVKTAISYVLGRVEAASRPSLDEERKHQIIMAQLRGMPVEMLDRSYNLHRLTNHGIDLKQFHPEYRTYQTFYEMGIAPPSHQEMADIIIEKIGHSKPN